MISLNYPSYLNSSIFKWNLFNKKVHICFFRKILFRTRFSVLWISCLSTIEFPVPVNLSWYVLPLSPVIISIAQDFDITRKPRRPKWWCELEVASFKLNIYFQKSNSVPVRYVSLRSVYQVPSLKTNNTNFVSLMTSIAGSWYQRKQTATFSVIDIYTPVMDLGVYLHQPV